MYSPTCDLDPIAAGPYPNAAPETSKASAAASQHTSRDFAADIIRARAATHDYLAAEIADAILSSTAKSDVQGIAHELQWAYAYGMATTAAVTDAIVQAYNQVRAGASVMVLGCCSGDCMV
jgi:hypothetical protein